MQVLPTSNCVQWVVTEFGSGINYVYLEKKKNMVHIMHNSENLMKIEKKKLGPVILTFHEMFMKNFLKLDMNMQISALMSLPNSFPFILFTEIRNPIFQLWKNKTYIHPE